MTPLGQLPFFIDFLKTAGLFDALVADCPLRYMSPNAPSKRDVLGTAMLSMLAGAKRYAHIAALRGDGVLPELLDMKKIVSEDAVRRAFAAIEEEAGRGVASRASRVLRGAAAGRALDSRRRYDDQAALRPSGRSGASATIPRSPGDRAIAITPIRWPATRLVFDVDVCAGDEHASNHAAPGAVGVAGSDCRAIVGRRCCAATTASATKASCARPRRAGWLICSSCG